MIINGKSIAKKIDKMTKRQVQALRSRGIIPVLLEIMVKGDSASQMYLRMKQRKAGQLGIRSIVKELPASVNQPKFLRLIKHYNHDPQVNGIVVQLPLPKTVDETRVNESIDPRKDADGVNPQNNGRLLIDDDGYYPVSCTPKGIITILRDSGVSLRGKRVVIIGRSRIVGRPMAGLLINAGALVTVLNHYARPLAPYTQNADVIISATGQSHLVKSEDVKPGATVVDVGEDMTPAGQLTGDVDFDPVAKKAGRITPVPGGVGPVTVSTLMRQVVELTKWSLQK